MSVYRVIDVIGTSPQSWEDAAATAANTARKTLRDLRVAEDHRTPLPEEYQIRERAFSRRLWETLLIWSPPATVG